MNIPIFHRWIEGWDSNEMPANQKASTYESPGHQKKNIAKTAYLEIRSYLQGVTPCIWSPSKLNGVIMVIA